ncbi:MAG: hypothetical protein ACI3VB_08575 [Oscillospiraceae bacterium]
MKKNKHQASEYSEYVESLSDSEREALSVYFRLLDQHLRLPREWKGAMLRDFESAILCCSRRGLPLSRTLELLSPSNLGGFYSRPATTWYPLDNAAKVYPLSMSHKQMAVFRLSAYMDEDVVPELLQVALTFTIKRFPFFATTIKKGFFWHYIDSAKRRFAVEPETYTPCAAMNVSISGSPSFRILYYKNRISAEFFHILTDGTGGMVFLKCLTAEYLRLLGHDIPCTDGVLDINDVPDAAESADDFDKCVSGKKTSGFVDKPALQMSGQLSKIKPCQIIHFDMDSCRLKALAHEKGASVTALMVSMMFIACKASTDLQHGVLHIQVPVNMRNYFKSSTLRNFALYSNVHMPIDEITTLDAIIPKVSKQLKEGISKDAMQEMMNGAVKLVKSLRLIPLFIKAPVAKIVYGFLGDRAFTTTLSNLGVVSMPEEMLRHIEKMDFVLGTVNLSRAACSMVTVGDTATFSVAKLTADPSFEERMYSLFKDSGLEPKVSGSELYGF